MTPHSAATIKLDDALDAIKVLHDRKIVNATKALQGMRGNVAQHRFEEARVLMEEVIPALKELAT